MSASQSPRPPGAQSMAVWGLYTLMPSAARRSRVCCWVSARDKLLRPLKMMGSMLDVKLGVLASSRYSFIGWAYGRLR